MVSGAASMPRRSGERDFSGYNAAQTGRPVRPLEHSAVAAAGPPGDGAVAVELGCGAGIEARFLAEQGFAVHALDGDASVAGTLEALAAELPVHPRIVDLAEVSSLPAADLILSCATLPFVPRDAFEALWPAVRGALRPGGVLAVDLFGDRDDWAGSEGTYLSRLEAEQLLTGLEIIELDEQEYDGRSFSGSKHWHVLRVLARSPRDVTASRRP